MLRGFRKNLDVIIVIIVISFVFTIFYGTFYRRSQNPVQDTAAAATVNDTVITINDLESQFRNFISRFDNKYLNQLDEKGINYLKRLTLESMINDELLYQEAKSRNIEGTNDEINTMFNQYKANFPSDEEFQNYLRYQGISTNDIKESIQRNLMVTHLTDSLNEGIVIPPEDIKKYYDDNKNLFSTPVQYHFLQMTFLTQDEADKVHQKVNLGEDFSSLAKSNSLDSFATTGGDAGWVAEDKLPNESKDLLITIKDTPGKVTPVIKIGNNYQFYKLVETKPAQEKTFEESQDQIKTTLESEQKRVKLEHLIAELREKGNVVFSESIIASGVVEPSPLPSPQSNGPELTPANPSTPIEQPAPPVSPNP